MAASQFTIYSSTDDSGPGPIMGVAGSLITVLDAILINGYAGKAAGGGSAWSHPVATSGNIATYKPAAGARQTLLINDNGPNGTSTYKEAWATGWETCAGVGAPVGTGTGQFPLPAQLLTTGKCVVRKSASADTVARYWIAFADAYTVYLFIAPGDSIGYYNGVLWFGDFYSFAGTSDAYRTILQAGAVENNTQIGSHTYNNSDAINTVTVSVANSVGRYIPRPFSAFGTSVTCALLGDMSKTAPLAATYTPMCGVVQTPNGPDNTLFMAAVNLAETGPITPYVIRGRVRGLYHLCHPMASFSDGQILYGANDFAGKTFQIVKPGPMTGMWCIEISATVETN